MLYKANSPAWKQQLFQQLKTVRCIVRKIQMYCQKDYDVLSERFGCTVRKIMMYCPKDSDLLSEKIYVFHAAFVFLCPSNMDRFHLSGGIFATVRQHHFFIDKS